MNWVFLLPGELPVTGRCPYDGEVLSSVLLFHLFSPLSLPPECLCEEIPF